MTAFRNHIFIAVLLVVLSIPAVAQIFSFPDPVPNEEKRTLAPLPTFPRTIPETQSFPRRLDDFLADHFGLRTSMLSLHSWLKWQLGMQFFPIAVRGKNDWFFLGDKYDQCMRQHTGLIPLPPEKISSWVARVADMRRRLRERGIDLRLLIVPDKQTIYPEFLPDGLQVPVGPTPLEQLTQLLHSEHADIGLIDVRAALLDAKNHSAQLLYYQQDSHWNTHGVFVGYDVLRRTLAADGHTGFLPTTDQFHIIPNGEEPAEIPMLISLGMVFRTSLTIEALKSGTHVREKNVNNDPSLFWIPMWAHTQSSAANALRVLIFKDSNLNRNWPLFEEAFRETIVVYRYTYPVDEAFIERLDPDIVIVEITERQFFKYVVQDGDPLVWPGASHDAPALPPFKTSRSNQKSSHRISQDPHLVPKY